MAQSDADDAPRTTLHACPATIERSVRLWSGVVLLVFVTMHLLNHAVGILGVPAMSMVQEWRVAVWRSWPGTIVLYGAGVLHMLLALKRALTRSTWRMPAMEAMQIVLGLLIPLLLMNHLVGTRLMASQVGFRDTYANVLRLLWPGLAVGQIILLAVVWTHGAIGIHFVARDRHWFRRLRPAFLVLSFVVPILAVAGFVAAAREAAALPLPPVMLSDAHFAAFERSITWANRLLWLVLGVAVLILVWRLVLSRLRPMVEVRFSGHGSVRSPRGLTLLEMARLHGIPHPAACGGRGRCATCRVMVLTGDAALPGPGGLEQGVLTRIRAPRHVRLACQIRPERELVVRTLLPVHADAKRRQWHADAADWALHQEVTVLFADMRGFSNLALHQPPAELMHVLSRVIDDLAQAAELRGGRVGAIETDGIMAVFGLGGGAGAGARAGMQAASDMLKAIESANRDLGLSVSQPVRIGVGLHTGEVIATEIGDAERGVQLVVIGHTVVIADRLEEATKEFAADCVISHHTLTMAGLAGRVGRTVQVSYKNGDAPVPAAALADRAELLALLGRRSATAAPAAAAPPTDAPAATVPATDTPAASPA